MVCSCGLGIASAVMGILHKSFGDEVSEKTSKKEIHNVKMQVYMIRFGRFIVALHVTYFVSAEGGAFCC